MPEKIFVSDLVDNDFIQSTFLVTAKEMRTTRNGDPYACLTLADSSGSIEGRIWDDAEALAERFEAEDFVNVRAQVSTYNDELQLKVGDIQPVAESEVELRDYLPHSKWSGEVLFGQLQKLVDEHVESEILREFIAELFGDEEFVAKFKRAPAAKSNHHEYFGGLIEHCLSMTRIGVSLSNHYANYYPGFVDQDLVIAGCILHDIGKVDELAYERAVSYTTEGKLVGHIPQGVEMITRVADRMEHPPPKKLLQQLKHLVLSHHGHREYGSPVEPRTPEAMLLHEIDMIDSRMNLFHSHLEEHRAGHRSDEPWTGYHGALESDIYAGPESSPDWSEALAPELDAEHGPGGSADANTGGESGADASEQSSETIDLFDE